MECCERVRMEAKFVRLDELQAFAGNAKSHDLGSIHLSVAQWGFLERIVVNEGTGHILSGHGRTDVLRQMRAAGQAPPEGITVEDGDWLVPVDYVSVPENQEGAVTIALNRTVELGGWDDVKLAELLQEIAVSDGDAFIATGFDGDDLDRLINDALELTSAGDSLSKPINERIKGADPTMQVKPVLYVDEIATFERAIKATGHKNRGYALVELCMFYLREHEKGQLDAGVQTINTGNVIVKISG